MNTSQEDSIRRARMEALADKQRSELPDKIDTLYALGRLTDAQYRALTGKDHA